MARIQTVGLLEVSPKQDDREPKCDLHTVAILERVTSQSR